MKKTDKIKPRKIREPKDGCTADDIHKYLCKVLDTIPYMAYRAYITMDPKHEYIAAAFKPNVIKALRDSNLIFITKCGRGIKPVTFTTLLGRYVFSREEWFNREKI